MTFTSIRRVVLLGVLFPLVGISMTFGLCFLGAALGGSDDGDDGDTGDSLGTPVFDHGFPDPTILVDGTSSAAEFGHRWDLLDTPGITSNGPSDWAGYWDAMPGIPSWATFGSTWAPSVAANAAGNFVEFYAASDTELGTHCIGRAVSTAPTGPFVDSSSAPFWCDPSLGGSIDLSVFTDGSGQHYLLWKSDGNSIGQPSHIWSV